MGDSVAVTSTPPDSMASRSSCLRRSKSTDFSVTADVGASGRLLACVFEAVPSIPSNAARSSKVAFMGSSLSLLSLLSLAVCLRRTLRFFVFSCPSYGGTCAFCLRVSLLTGGFFGEVMMLSGTAFPLDLDVCCLPCGLALEETPFVSSFPDKDEDLPIGS